VPLKISSKRSQLEELVQLILPEIIQECSDLGFKPTINHLINRINSKFDIVKTGLVGLNFHKAEVGLKSKLRNSIIKILYFSDLTDKINPDFEFFNSYKNEKVILINRDFDTCDSLILETSLEFGVDAIIYNEFNLLSVKILVERHAKSRIYFACDLSPNGLKELRKIKNICDESNIYFENFLIKIEDADDRCSLKLSLKEKIANKEYTREHGDHKFLIDLMDREIIKDKVKEIISK
jgi:hypothetical protein